MQFSEKISRLAWFTGNFTRMTQSTRTLLRIISIVLALLLILDQMGIVIIPFLTIGTNFWLMVVCYGLLLFSMKLR